MTLNPHHPKAAPTPKPPPPDWEAKWRWLRDLHQVSEVVHSTLDPTEALQLIVREAVRLTQASSGSMALVNPTTGFLEIQAACGLPARALRLRLRVGEGLTGWVARTGLPLRIEDVRLDPRYLPLRRGVRSELAVPLTVEGDLRGVLNVDSTRMGAFSDEDQEALTGIAHLAAKVIHNTWRFEQLRLKARLLESLISVSQTINSTQGLDEVLQVITREASHLMGAKLCSVLMLDEHQEWLDLRACHGAGQAYIAKPRLAVADSLLGVVVRRKKPLQVENVQISSRYQSVEVARREGLVSLLSVPLVFNQQAIGVLSVYTGQSHNFSNEEIRILSALADLSAIAIAKARMHERIVELKDQLHQSERLSALGLLAAEVAHEIRNPLTVMKMLHHSIDPHFPPEDPRARDFQILGEKMDHLNRIVELILDFSRSTEPRLEPVDLTGLISDLALLTRQKFVQHNVALVQILAPGLPRILADAAQLEQAFLNLSLNAIEAMPDGGQLTIRTRPLRAPADAPQPTHVQIEFKDTGHGMSPEHCRRAWTSLLQTTKRTGTGLGLAIVAKIIEAHRGKISIKSQPGRGTSVSILLPLP